MITRRTWQMFVVVLIVSGYSPLPAAAQAQVASDTKTLRARRIDAPLKLDGVLDEPAWQQADVASDFVQQDPHVNEPVSEHTEIRVVFDKAAIYFGITCHDSDPDGVIARELRRDNLLRDDDRFEFLLDTFHDHRNAFHFMINPLGTQYDALITDEGQDVNADWDERWWSEARITTEGWTAEIKIPFTTLRSAGGLDTWGVNFKRYIRRKNESAHWTGWERDFPFLQISKAGHLVGVDGIRAGLKLRVKPYGLAGSRNTSRGGASDLRRISDIGLETMKFGVTPGLTAELTANTDFAQTEVDDAVVNLTRFPVFFPEKRTFFLERAGIFEFGLGGRRGGAAERNLQMFFSRRMGLTDDRRPVPIRAGAKLIGRAAGLDLGLLNVQTSEFDGASGSNYTVLRAKRNVFARSNVGIFAANRQATRGDYNRVLGADVNFTVFKNTDIQGFLSKSLTPGLNGNDYAGRAKYNWYTDRYEAFFEHLYIGPDFQNDVAYVRRKGIQRSDAAFIWQPRPDVLNIRNLVIRQEVVYTTDIRGALVGRDQIFQWTTRFQNDDAFRANTTDTLDRVDRAFEIAQGIVVPVGEYRFRDSFVEVEGSGKRVLAGRLRYGGGDLYSGRRRYVQISPSFKPMPLVSVETGYEFNEVTLREGAFTTHVVNGRLNLNLSNKWLTTTLEQYDSAARRHVLFFRLNYIFRPGDDLFIVFNETRQRGPLGQSQRDRVVMVKWTYSLDF